MKKVIRHWAPVAFLFLIATLLSKCTKIDYPPNVRPEVPEFLSVTESGGTFMALDGNVILTVPEGAVPQPVSIKISKFSSYSEELGDHLLLFPIVIKPLVGFDKNVQLSLRYDSELSNGKTVNGSMNLMAYNWYSEENIEENVCENCENCSVDMNGKMIKVCINRTGIFAVKTND